MIVNEGKIELLKAQVTYLQACKWHLFTNNFTPDVNTVLSMLTEAAWTGYTYVVVGTLSAPAIVGGRAQCFPTAYPSFTNGSGSPVNFYGWYLTDAAVAKLLAIELMGLTTIPAGLSKMFTPSFSDTQE